MHRKNTSAALSAQPRYIDHVDIVDGHAFDFRWQPLLKGAPPASVLAVPTRAEPVRIGSVNLGYRLSHQHSERQRYSHRLQRLSEIAKVIVARTGGRQLTTDDAEIVALIAAHHAGEPNAARGWIARWCPALSSDVVDEIIDDVLKRRRRWKADSVAKLLNVTFEERQRLRLTTIGACDMPTATRKRIVAKQKADRSRERKAAERRAKGIKPRPLGDRAAAEAATLGISRSELYRRRKQARDANGHTSVTCTPIGVAVGVQSEGPVRAARKPPAWVLRALDNPICIVPAEHRPETARIGLLVAAQAAAVRAASIGRAA